MAKKIRPENQPVNLNKRILLFALALAALLLLALGINMLFQQQSPNDPMISDDPPGLFPAENQQTNTQMVTLYFRYSGESYLATDTRKITVGSDERLEAAVLRELIKGPTSSIRPQLEALINSQTQVVNIEEDGDILYVTFSGEFLQTASSLPEGWEWDLSLREENFLRKRLCAQAVANTLIGLGTYSKVQILVDTEGTGVGKRPTWAQLGYEDLSESKRAGGLLGFDESVVLTPQNTLNLLFKSILEDDYSRAYPFIASQDSSGQRRPRLDEFTQASQEGSRLKSYQLQGCTIATDGQSAVVRVDLTFADGQGHRTREQIPVKMRLENEVWKVGYDVLERVLELAS